MSKTILMTVIAFTVLATVAIPTVSACPPPPESNPVGHTLYYATCNPQKGDDIQALIAYALEGVGLVLEIVDHAT